MRNTFINKLIDLASINEKIILVVGDLGYSVVEQFQNKFPTRFFNAGIAEQNMASMAAGLASEGYHVFIYSIANFPTFRCAEQLRNDVGYHNLPVTVVAVGGGMSYGNLGYSHHAIQDLGLMRLFPEFDLICPGDPNETEKGLEYIVNNPGPSYFRLKKTGEPNFSISSQKLVPGIWNEISPSLNGKILLTTSGGLEIAHNLIAKNSSFKNFGIYTCPIWGYKYKSIQQDQINLFDTIVTVEDHLLDAGFGSWIRESITNIVSHQKITHMALSQNVIGKVGTEKYLLSQGGLIF